MSAFRIHAAALDELRRLYELTLSEQELQESRWVFTQPAFREEIRRWHYEAEVA